MSNVPDWWTFILLALAAFRVYRLIAEDTILDGPRAWLLRLPRNWEEGDVVPEGFRLKWASFLTCPWCAGFWISVGWWLAWIVWPHAALVLAVPWAISTVVALAAKNLDETD